MSTFCLHIGVFIMLTVKVFAQINIALIEEISTSYTYPEELWRLTEELINLLITVLIDRDDAT